MFTNIARWQKQQKRWTDGEFLTLESEAISSELDDLFRETYKSNKTFETRRKQAAEKAPKKPKGKEKPNVILRMCNTIMNNIKGFRDNVPLIATLCNPGIRERHWQQMSDICGFDITPDAGKR